MCPSIDLIFYFNDVILADSTSNEAASHGFIKFSIKPLKTLTIGSIVNNTAFIYFDYNTPIVTNTTNNKIIQLTEVKDIDNWQSMNIAPNPTAGIVNFSLPESFKYLLEASLQLEVVDISGQIVLNKQFINQSINTINLDNLNTGLYFIVIKNNKQRIVGKIMLNK